METVLKGLRLPKDIIDRIEKYQRENYIQTFTQAVIQLLVKGLEKENRRKEVK